MALLQLEYKKFHFFDSFIGNRCLNEDFPAKDDFRDAAFVPVAKMGKAEHKRAVFADCDRYPQDSAKLDIFGNRHNAFGIGSIQRGQTFFITAGMRQLKNVFPFFLFL